MANLPLTSRRRSLLIRTPDEINSVAIERLLHRHYAASLNTSQVTFDLSTTTWLGIFELSILTMWSLELRNKGIAVEFDFPVHPSTLAFLIEYHFDAALRERGVQVRSSVQTGQTAALVTLRHRPFFPLTFFDDFAFFRSTLDSLRQNGALTSLMQSVDKSHVVRSGAIRDVVLSELGDNVFVHGGGHWAHLIMTKLTAPAPPPEHWQRSKQRSPAVAEREYLAKIANAPYIALVIGDKGPGIAETIRESYLADDVITPTADPSEADLLQYAFLYHTTRRTTQERVGALAALLRSGEDFPPPTGLFRLLETVRHFGGFMMLRSGRTILTYDALVRDEPQFEAFANVGQLRSLAYFNGCEFKLFFPVEIPTRYVGPTRTSTLRFEAPDREYSYVAVDQLVPPETTGDNELEAAAVLAILNRVERERLTRKSADGLLVAGMDASGLSQKALHYLLLELARRQTERWANILVDVDQDLVSAATVLLARPSPDAKPLLAVDRAYGASIVVAGETSLIPYDSEALDSSELGNGHAFGHLFDYSPSEDRYWPRHGRAALAQALRDGVEQTITAQLTRTDLRVYRPNVLVLLPSRKYCRGYFELYRVLEHAPLRRLIRQWVHLILLEHEPTVVLSVGRVAGSITDDAFRDLPSDSTKARPLHTRLSTASKPLDIVRVGLEVPKDSKLLIVTDVIGTGEQLRSLLRYVGYARVTAITTIVDARQGEQGSFVADGRAHDVVAAVRQPLSYHTDLPDGWLYRDVSQVDPVSGRLQEPFRADDGPIWQLCPQDQLGDCTCAAMPLTGRSSAKLRRSPFAEYWRAGEGHVFDPCRSGAPTLQSNQLRARQVRHR